MSLCTGLTDCVSRNYNIFINGIENKHGNNKIKKDINFRTLAIQAFRDLPEFEIIDLNSVQGHGQGDFQLKFKYFSVLVDAKIYSNNINSKLKSIIDELIINMNVG